jgi:hypothetical protein
MISFNHGGNVGGAAAEYRWNASKTNPMWVEDDARNQEEQGEVF